MATSGQDIDSSKEPGWDLNQWRRQPATADQESQAYFQEAPISREDVEKAGGLGARDDIGFAVPTAMDATDREEELRAFEDPKNPEAGSTAPAPSHPGLGSKIYNGYGSPCSGQADFQRSNLQDGADSPNLAGVGTTLTAGQARGLAADSPPESVNADIPADLRTRFMPGGAIVDRQTDLAGTIGRLGEDQ